MSLKERLDKHSQLREAIKKGDQDAARQLILNNSILNLNKSSNTLLHWAMTQFQDAEIFEILLDKKANVHAKNHNRQTPLNLAVRLNKPDIVKLLLNKGGHIGEDLKSLIYNATNNGNEMIVKLLVDYGLKNNVSVNLKNSLGVAVENGYSKIVEYIIPYCKFQKLSDKQIPKYAILKDGQQFKDCIDLLLQHGFIIGASSKKDTNFIYSAVEKGCTAIVRELLKIGIDVNIVNKRTGLNLLHAACLNKHFEIAEMLIKHNTDVNLMVTEGKLSRKDKLTFEKIMNLVGKTPLYITVNNSDTKLTKLLLDNGANINNDPNFFTIINIAMKHECKDIIEMLLDHGADINAANDYGKTLLHYCAMYNFRSSDESIKHEIAELLLQKGAKVNAQTQIGNTPLFYAIQNGCTNVANVLLKYNADVQHKNIYGNTSLHVATGEFINPKFIDILLSHNVDVNIANENGMTPLHIACQRVSFEDVKIVEKLLHYHADVNCIDENKKTPLHFACDQEDVKVIEVLLEHNAQINVTDKHGKTPLHIASGKKNINIIEILLNNNADPNVKDKDGKTPLHIVSSGFHEKDIISLLLQHNADINATDAKGKTPLFNACEAGGIAQIKLLLDNNANVNCVDSQGSTPLCIVAQSTWRNSQLIELLLQYKANVYFINQEGKTLLHIVAEQNHLDIVETLIKMNINIDFCDNQGRTALHLATEKGYKEMVESLLKHGVNINVLSKNQQTALHYIFNNIAHLRKELNNHREKLRNFTDGRVVYEDFDDEKIDSYKCEIYSYKEIVKVLKEHIIKLKCADLNINKENFYLVYGYAEENDEYSDDEDDDEVQVNTYDYECDCEGEIEKLKVEHIGKNNITFYDILTRNTHNIARYSKNESLTQSLELNIYSNKFPLYIDMVKTRFAKAVVRSKILEIAQKYSRSSVFHGLPHNCVDEIFSYLSTIELKIFINVVKS